MSCIYHFVISLICNSAAHALLFTLIESKAGDMSDIHSSYRRLSRHSLRHLSLTLRHEEMDEDAFLVCYPS
jgi:hypothetical protein